MLTGSHYLHLTSCLENEDCAEAPSHSQEHQKQTTSTCLLHPHLFLLRELCPEPRLPLALKFIGLCPYSYSPRTPHVDMPPTAGCLGHPVQHHPWHTASGTWQHGRPSWARGGKLIHSVASVQGDWLHQGDSPSICVHREHTCHRACWHYLRSQEEGNSQQSGESCWCFILVQRM